MVNYLNLEKDILDIKNRFDNFNRLMELNKSLPRKKRNTNNMNNNSSSNNAINSNTNNNNSINCNNINNSINNKVKPTKNNDNYKENNTEKTTTFISRNKPVRDNKLIRRLTIKEIEKITSMSKSTYYRLKEK